MKLRPRDMPVPSESQMYDQTNETHNKELFIENQQPAISWWLSDTYLIRPCLEALEVRIDTRPIFIY